ncbi:transporter substrate-binding domain-containing protein [Pseudodesulfovibrio indicus]|uniref:substrate-binding periplasmic protein n=1 Tax=Pseudodesulfovibrio indicus TaxID=1716143 RepID=UPI002931E74A|nr:transporter substrate-binding domain-containing protein [Pseudodesulfovibrio indicus]
MTIGPSGRWIAAPLSLFFLLALALYAWALPGACLAAPPDPRPQMVFSSFSSNGMSELFGRILSEAYAELGFEVVIWKLPPERALIMANEGFVDGEAARVAVIEKEFPNLIRVPTPLYFNRIAVFTKRSDYDPESGFRGMGDRPVCICNGYKFLEKATTGMDRHTVASYENMLALLQNDRVEFGLAEYFDILPTLAKVKLDGIRILDKPLAVNPMYHYLNRKHADLVPAVNRVLSRMADEGRMEEIAHSMTHEFLGESLSPCPMLKIHN